jgi:hypothetical protein
MTRRPNHRRGVFLSELVVALGLAALLVFLLGRLFVDSIYLQRIATQHTNRAAVIDDFARQVTKDARSATTADFTDGVLELSLRTPAGPATVHYTFEPEAARRTGPLGTESVWRSIRLRFDTTVERGPDANLLQVTFTELAPPRRSALLPRSFSQTFLLPAEGAAPEEQR